LAALALGERLLSTGRICLGVANVYPLLLFSIYISSLLSVVKDLLPTVYCYADDNQLYVSFSLADENGHSDAIAAMKSCVRVIRNWMHDNRLLMNETVTEFLLIGTKQQLAKVNVDHVKVGNADIVPHSPVDNPGVWLQCIFESVYGRAHY